MGATNARFYGGFQLSCTNDTYVSLVDSPFTFSDHFILLVEGRSHQQCMLGEKKANKRVGNVRVVGIRKQQLGTDARSAKRHIEARRV